MATFAERLKFLRKEKKLTQQELADKIGISRVGYGYWEKGSREPSFDKLVELATELNSTVDYLLGISDENILEIQEDDIKKLNKDELKKVDDVLFKNFQDIAKGASIKFHMSEDEALKMVLEFVRKETGKMFTPPDVEK